MLVALSVVEQRLDAVRLVLAGATVTEVAARVGVSRASRRAPAAASIRAQSSMAATTAASSASLNAAGSSGRVSNIHSIIATATDTPGTTLSRCG